MVHKGNIMKYTEGAFRNLGYEMALNDYKGVEEDGKTYIFGKNNNKIEIKDCICDAFLQQILLKPEEYDVVMHLDNNPLNNYYKNLKWGNQAENNKQKQTDRRGNKYHDRLKLRVYRYKLRHPKATFRYISAWFGISLTKCRQICRGSDFSTKDLPDLSQHF